MIPAALRLGRSQSTGWRRWLGRAATTARVVAAATVVRRLVGVAGAADPLHRATAPEAPSITVVIPARDEAERIGPVLAATVRAPGVDEVVVVDDQSTDDTAAIATAAGARVISGSELPAGWAGKAWALQQGVEAATSEWVVTLDADTRPDPRLASSLVARAVADGFDFVTVGGRFDCPTPGTRWLHASMLTTLVYRFGAPGADAAPDRTMANGQCTATRRDPFLVRGGMSAVRGEVVEDVALARHLARSGWRVGFLDGADLLTVRMFESFGDTWRGWGRSLALPGVETTSRQIVDLAVIAVTQALPIPRLALGRGDVLDAALVAIRLGTLNGTRSAYERADVAYWLSPLADPLSAVAIARGIVRRRQTWRGRTYG